MNWSQSLQSQPLQSQSLRSQPLQSQPLQSQPLQSQPQTTNTALDQNSSASYTNFELDRVRERSGDLFSWLLQQSTIYGVNDELAREVLSKLSAAEVADELEACLLSTERCEEVARRSYMHGNGFYKLVLCTDAQAKLRLHYWDQQQSAEENIHNHRWKLASRVLLGELSSELYAQCADNDDGGLSLEARLYQKELGAMSASGLPLGRRSVRCTRRVTRVAGEAYAMNVGTLHRIVRPESAPKTLTLMLQSAPVYQDNYMLSLDHVEEPKLNPEPLTVTELRGVLRTLITELRAADLRGAA